MPDIFKLFRDNLQRYRFRLVLITACFWTLVDMLFLVMTFDDIFIPKIAPHLVDPGLLLWRTVVVFFLSFATAYLMVYKLRNIYFSKGFFVRFIYRSLLILGFVLIYCLLIGTIHLMYNDQENLFNAVPAAVMIMFRTNWFIIKLVFWLIVYFGTLVMYEVYEKYAPGTFFRILTGRYRTPQQENRIVMFIDLKDSTPIAEKLGHEAYFHFIRDFILDLSTALVENRGIIYQYVGDEIVVSWTTNAKNVKRCIRSLVEARRLVQKDGDHYRREYGINPEFRCGIHTGMVTIGEIGLVKKDLAMSGDTMNTAARIRSACNDFNEKFLLSEDFLKLSDLKDFQVKFLGNVELKGKSAEIKLYALQV
ncbi:adenylate/guanylate cyclase domain-containing protein [Flavihumibacter sediminis]|nr:adenylate/guanylate cyclase domain-containing protein [Flavihumibacter sediminis]